MGSGEAKKGKGICRGVTITLSELTIIEDFLPFELGNIDVILGVQWLRKQGQMLIDWKKLYMRFTVAGTEVTIDGDPTLAKMEVTLKVTPS